MDQNFEPTVGVYAVFNTYAIPVIMTHIYNLTEQLRDERILAEEAKDEIESPEV